MRRIKFFKVVAAGNDFVITQEALPEKYIPAVCNRRFGVGADGLIHIDMKPGSRTIAFGFRYWNRDGSVAGFCGNGARAAAMVYAMVNGLSRPCCFVFRADDGLHKVVMSKDNNGVYVSFRIRSVDPVPGDVNWDLPVREAVLVNSGVPHLLLRIPERVCTAISSAEFENVARKLRYDSRFGPNGVNVSIYSSEGNTFVRTYERGVEAETPSCGTAVAALAYLELVRRKEKLVRIFTRGGKFRAYRLSEDEVMVAGPVSLVFIGEWLGLVPHDKQQG